MKGQPLPAGTQVTHVPLRAKATILKAINLDDDSDIRLQGIRYLIQHSGWLWSVPERFLHVDDTPSLLKHSPRS